MSNRDAQGNDFERLLAFLKQTRGFDFSSYKRTTLQRRVQKRMTSLGIDNYSDYIDYLEVHQDEYQQLFNTILINVTSFFRDVEAWDYFTEVINSQVLAEKRHDGPIRVWVAGCASGQEAYSVAMMLAEALGSNVFRDRVKIYATDLDDDALSSSRFASYSEREIENVPEALLGKYFERVNDRFIFDRDLRRCVIFGRHDLISDAPISRVDLLLCRNTLMYFNAETQERILGRFHFALNDTGLLFLGKAETLLTHTNLFTPLDLRNRIFSKVPRHRLRDRAVFLNPLLPEAFGTDANATNRLRDHAFEQGPLAQVIVDLSGRLCYVSEPARTLLSLNPRDLGRPFQDLELSYRPVELRSGIEEAIVTRRAVSHRDVGWSMPNGEKKILHIRISALLNESSEVIGSCITFDDVTQYKRLQEELINFNQELETAYEEVQSTNEELQTTNEELQSTVEELETTNEELQSTNEELETMNEELQSANEELETMNEELRLRGAELNRANYYLESILAGLRDAVIVLNIDLHILAWNYRAEDFWGVRSDEAIGKHIFALDVGLPVEQLRPSIRQCLASKDVQELRVESLNRRGKLMACQIVISPLAEQASELQGIIIVATCLPSENVKASS